MGMSFRGRGRRTPAKGVHLSFQGPNWVFLTVNTAYRIRWLAQPSVHHALHQIWLRTATAWLVSDYLLMPDHLHLFCAPRDWDCSIERWMKFWKGELTKACKDARRFQVDGFHHRLRNGESYAQKWLYVRENPVRAGLVSRAEDWPYKGCVHDIRWVG
jgi:putative transposase